MSEDQSTPASRRRLDDMVNWALHDGMVCLQMWVVGEEDPSSVWMSPGQALELMEKGARAARLALKGQL